MSDETLRASDAERESAVHALGKHYVDGRLDRSEFDERVDAALAARTRRQLDELFTDLPGPSQDAVMASVGQDGRRGAVPAGGFRRWGEGDARSVPPPILPLLLIPVVLALAVTSVVHGLPPFPLIVLAFILMRRARRWNSQARPWG